MAITTRNGARTWVLRDTKESLRRYLVWLGGLTVFLVAARYISEQTLWVFVWDAPAQVQDFLSRMFPPDVRYFNRISLALWDTINIAVFGTLLGLVVAFPLGIMAAKNTTPHALLRTVALTLIVAARSINTVIWAMLLVIVTGPGLFAGVLAIAIRSVGMIGKMFYETIEETNREPIEAVTATGASPAQVFAYGYLPQLMPAYVGITVYRWEVNIRESTILGLVGGGGIGLLLNSAINRLAWNQVIVVLITILATVFVAEVVSNRIRGAVT